MSLRTIPEIKEGTYRAKASGTLPNGKPVVVNSDGTVGVVDGVAQELGSPTVFESANTNSYKGATFDSNSNKVVIAYTDLDNSSYGTAVVGTVSGTTISFGTPVVFESGGVEWISPVFDSSNNRVVIAYKDNPNADQGTAIVGTVSSTSISFGSPTVFNSGSTVFDISAVFDSNSNKVVVAYRDFGNSNYGTAIVGTVSGTAISFGSEAVFESATTVNISASFDSNNNKVVIAYMDSGNSNYGTAVVGTVNGTAITFGTPVVFEEAHSDSISSTFDSNENKIVISYRERVNNFGTAIVGTVSGTSISFGTAVVFESANVDITSLSFDSNINRVVVSYRDQGNSAYGTFVVGTVSGTAISFGTATVFESAFVNFIASTFDSSNNRVVVAYSDDGNSNHGTSVVIKPGFTTLTSTNYIGLSEGAVDIQSQSQALGSEVVFENADTRLQHGSAVFDTNENKIAIVYRDVGNSNYGTAVVGTVSGTSISFGTPVVFESASSEYTSAVFDSANNKVVAVYSDRGNTDFGTAIVGTVSGTSISFGSPAVFESADAEYVTATFDSSNNKVVVAYHDNGNSSYGTAVVGTVSSTSISFGTPVVFESADSRDISATFDSNENRVVIAYKDVGNSNYGTAIVGTVSDTSISFGTAVVYEDGEATTNCATFDPINNKVVVIYEDNGNSDQGTAVVGTVSGTSISFGSPTVFSASHTGYPVSVFDSNAEKIVITYEDVGDSNKGKYIVGTVSDTSITFDTAAEYSDGVGFLAAAYDSASEKVVSVFRDPSTSDGTAIVIQPAFTNITRGQVADGSSAVTSIVGTVSTNQLDLTPGQQYYVQTDGTLNTAEDDPSVLAGTAVTSTSLLVKL